MQKLQAHLLTLRQDLRSPKRTVFKSTKLTITPAIRHLLYLSTRARPDIAYAVSNVTRFNADPRKEHWRAVKRIMRYLNGSQDMGLLYKGSYGRTSWLMQMLIELETLTTESQHLDTSFSIATQLIVCERRHRHVWHSLLQKQNTCHWQVRPKKHFGSKNF